jgi:radical SAM superfamily enzyme YgiQ (UPF0313 family)
VEIKVLSTHFDNAEIILINPPNYSFGRVQSIRKTSPPLGLLYIGTFLKKKGYRVKIIDGMIQPGLLEDMSKADSNFKVVGLTSTTPTVASALATARMIKENKPNCSIVLGGPHACICYPDLIQEECVDYVVLGEGEYVFENLCNAIISGKVIKDWSGIISKDHRVKVSRPGYIIELDNIPFPDRSLIPLKAYVLSPINYKTKPSAQVITTRGCPFGCTFCSNPVHGRKVRHHSPEYVIEEIKYLKREFGVKDIAFWDDTFTLDAGKVETICRLMLKENLACTWSCTGRVDRINADLLRLMKKAGCWQIAFGVESGSERLLKKIKKGITRSQIISAFDLCNNIGIETRAFFILGIPSETLSESYETIEFAKSLKPSYAQFSLAVPYPGSEWYHEAIATGWSSPEWEYFNTYPQDEPVYVPSGRTGKELFDLQSYAVKSFYFRPSYIFNRLKSINSMRDLVKYIRVAYNLIYF